MNENNLLALKASITGRPMLFDETYLNAICEMETGEPLVMTETTAIANTKAMPGTRGVVVRGSTAIVSIHGPLSTRSSFWTMLFGGTSYEDIINDLSAVQGVRGIKNVILDVDSPGGTVDGVTDAEAAVHALRKSGKGVAAYCSGMNCSAAYWISSAAEVMVAAPTAMIGSVGVVAYVSTKKDNSYKAYTSKGAENKANINYNLQEHLDEIEAVFLTSVTANRGLTGTFIEDNWEKGASFPAATAQKVRMVDSIDNIERLL